MQLHLPLTLVGALLLGGAAASDVPTASNELTEVYFNTGSSFIRKDAAKTIANTAEQLRANSNSKVFLGAFADPRGTAPDNVALSIRRGEAVKNYLTFLGVPEDRIVLGIYGEDGPHHKSLARDRRVSIGLTDEPLHEVVKETLSEAVAIVWSEPVTAAELEGPRPIPVATREQ